MQWPADVLSIVVGAFVALVLAGLVWGVVGTPHAGEKPSAAVIGQDQFGGEPRNTSFVVSVRQNGTTRVERGVVHVTASGVPSRTVYVRSEDGVQERRVDGYQRQLTVKGTGEVVGVLSVRTSFANRTVFERVKDSAADTSRIDVSTNDTLRTVYYSFETERTRGPPFLGVDGRVVEEHLSLPSYERVEQLNETHVKYAPRSLWVRNVSGREETWRVRATTGYIVYDAERELVERANISYTVTRDSTWASVWFEEDSGRDRKRVSVRYTRTRPSETISQPSWVENA